MNAQASSQARKTHGVMAEFSSAEALVEAARRARAAGYRRLEAYAPFPIEELPAALGLPPSPIPRFMLGGGLAGTVTGLAMQYYANLHAFPMNVGGRPLNAWPGFILVTVELTILGAILTGLLALFFTLHLPEVYHPVFNHPDFRRASRDGFFLCIEFTDPNFAAVGAADFLRELAPLSVRTVEP
jgi:hypothetical protein